MYGSGSLTLPAVTAADGTTFQAYQPNVSSGTPTVGTIGLPGLKTITGASVSILAAGSGSTIDLPKLASIAGTYTGGYSGYDTLSVTQSGTVVAPLLKSLAGTFVILDGTGTIATSQWTSLTDGALEIQGGDYSPTSSKSGGPFAGLTDINGSAILVSGGGSLTLPKVTSYQPLIDNYVFSQGMIALSASGAKSALEPAGPRLDQRERHHLPVRPDDDPGHGRRPGGPRGLDVDQYVGI